MVEATFSFAHCCGEHLQSRVHRDVVVSERTQSVCPTVKALITLLLLRLKYLFQALFQTIALMSEVAMIHIDNPFPLEDEDWGYKSAIYIAICNQIHIPSLFRTS